MKTRMLIAVMILLVSTSFKPGNEGMETGKISEKGNPGEFKLVKNVSDIRISTRWIPVTEDRSARQIKAEYVINGPVSKVLSVLCNDASFVKWMKGIKDYYRLKTVNPVQWYSYIQFGLPWPLQNQDCIIKYEIAENAQKGITVVSLTGMPAFLKSFDGVDRIPHMEGTWRLTDLGNNKVGVEYMMYSNQKSKFPRWITDPIIQKSMVETMDAFRSMVNKGVSNNLTYNEKY